MTIEASIYSALSSLARTAPIAAEQGASLPRITYQRVSGLRPLTMTDGYGITRQRYQIDVWAATFEEAVTLGEQARQALLALNVGELADNPQDFEEDTKLYRDSFDVAIWQ